MQVVSDIHLEHKKAKAALPEIEVNCDILCLLGDIGYPFLDGYKEFIGYQSKRFKNIIVVAGNHEFYCPDDNIYTFEQVLTKIKNICSLFSNVYFLYRNSIELNCFNCNVRFIGATLWSDIPVKFKYDIGDLCNDYEYIYTKLSKENIVNYLPMENCNLEERFCLNDVRNLTVEEQNQLHQADLNFIKEEINEAKKNNQIAIVLTHHAPTDENTVPEDEDWEPLRYMNFTKLEYLFVEPVKIWAFGHTHRCSKKIYNNNCIVYSNQLGYVKEHDPNFQAGDVIVIK